MLTPYIKIELPPAPIAICIVNNNYIKFCVRYILFYIFTDRTKLLYILNI